ncbi:TPA: restriction endonuclease subunit S [Vibrio parahaemolyticus]|uniref:restriction endonuclease subunit S n=1 Tax=Vibrio TaxID=662 RepID=UPI00102BFA1D|nr:MULTISPECIES: restriction endonuclease subunit S [Vibrio]MBY7803087.1 restriction endonuclease subunit S [Vibrio fluvialis]MBE3800280.1 restriction endonuclease subunit S [Vibrio parahaemolyticus]MBE3983948.1 restriction endonuclease subunit S [Vibrio parahaemolyticus]MCA0785245.1 restriction endonuclease subunit S [Vibrio vulnificus]MDF5246467.1 restriction endonuclease subunit S [Vibrio parahaemolyticus]
MTNITRGWTTVEFGEFVSIKCSKFDPKSQSYKKKCIELEHIEQQSGRTIGYTSTLESTSTKNVFSKGDVLFGKLRPYLKKFTLAPFDGVCSSEIWVLSPNKHLRKNFLYYLIQTDSFLDQANKSCGTKMPRADWKVVSKYRFLLPPLDEQQKIVEVLSTVDKKIDLIDQKIAETEKLKTCLIQKLFSEGIGVQEGNGTWQAHTKFQESMYGSIPLCWEISTFKELLKSKDVLEIQDGNHGESHPVSSDFVSEGVPFITANKISSHNKLLTKSAKKISHEQYNSLRIGFSKPGDVILTHKGTVGLTAIVSEEDGELMMSPQTTYYRLGENSCLINSFLYYFFQSSGFKRVLKRKSQQSTRAYIGITKQAELSVLIPSLKEQKQISTTLNSVDSKLGLLTEQKIELKTLKKGLMQKLLTGEWRVPVEETEAA